MATKILLNCHICSTRQNLLLKESLSKLIMRKLRKNLKRSRRNTLILSFKQSMERKRLSITLIWAPFYQTRKKASVHYFDGQLMNSPNRNSQIILASLCKSHLKRYFDSRRKRKLGLNPKLQTKRKTTLLRKSERSKNNLLKFLTLLSSKMIFTSI